MHANMKLCKTTNPCQQQKGCTKRAQDRTLKTNTLSTSRRERLKGSPINPEKSISYDVLLLNIGVAALEKYVDGLLSLLGRVYPTTGAQSTNLGCGVAATSNANNGGSALENP